MSTTQACEPALRSAPLTEKQGTAPKRGHADVAGAQRLTKSRTFCSVTDCLYKYSREQPQKILNVNLRSPQTCTCAHTPTKHIQGGGLQRERDRDTNIVINCAGILAARGIQLEVMGSFPFARPHNFPCLPVLHHHYAKFSVGGGGGGDVLFFSTGG